MSRSRLHTTSMEGKTIYCGFSDSFLVPRHFCFVHVQIKEIKGELWKWMTLCNITIGNGNAVEDEGEKKSLALLLLTIDKFDQVEEEMYIEEQLSQMGLVEFETFNWFRWKKTYGDDVSWQEHWIKIIALQNVYSLPNSLLWNKVNRILWFLFWHQVSLVLKHCH